MVMLIFAFSLAYLITQRSEEALLKKTESFAAAAGGEFKPPGFF